MGVEYTVVDANDDPDDDNNGTAVVDDNDVSSLLLSIADVIDINVAQKTINRSRFENKRKFFFRPTLKIKTKTNFENTYIIVWMTLFWMTGIPQIKGKVRGNCE